MGNLVSVCRAAIFFPCWMLMVNSAHLLASFTNQQLVIYKNPFNQETMCSRPLVVVAVGGKKGNGKSKVLSSLGLFTNTPNSYFQSGDKDSFDPTTTEISVSDVNKEGIVFVDLMGKLDPMLKIKFGLESSKIDLMSTSLVAPVVNVLIYTMRENVDESDLTELAVFCENHHLGTAVMTSQLPKPLLVLLMRTSKKGTPAKDIFEPLIPPDHPLRSKFSNIKYILLGEVYQEGPEYRFLTEGSFDPEKIPEFWNTIELLSRDIMEYARQLPISSRLTGCGIGAIMAENLPKINKELPLLDSPDMYKLLVQQKVITAAKESMKRINAEIEENKYLTNPLRIDSVKEKVNQLFETEKDILRVTFKGREPELVPMIETTISQELDLSKNTLIRQIDSKIDEIQKEAKMIYENAIKSIQNAPGILSLTGHSDEVTLKLKPALVQIVEDYQRKMENVFIESSVKDLKESELVISANKTLCSTHKSNQNIRNERYHTLYQKVERKELYFAEPHKVCANGEGEFKFNLTEKYPQYFGRKVAEFLQHVTVRIHSNDECEGALTLVGGEEREVCRQHSNGGRNGQFKQTILYYNPSTGIARIKLLLGNFGSGCNNFLDFFGLRFTLYQREIVNELSLTEPYKTDPVCELCEA